VAQEDRRVVRAVRPSAVETKTASPLTIAAVTAVLRDLLANGLIGYSNVTRLGDVQVTVLPPDRITLGGEEPNQLNLFMYRVAPHASLARSRMTDGGADRVTRFSPAVDLHYLLTAYGSQDLHCEILLGCAMHLLNQVPLLTADLVKDILEAPTTKGGKASASPVRMALATSGVTSLFDRLRVTQQFMSFDEMSKLWSTLQAPYRPSVIYEVAAVPLPTEG
jgi:uncharacterized protein DUF4255